MKPGASIVVSNAEALLKVLVDNKFVKGFPVLSTVVNFVSGALDVRDRLFVSKLTSFVTAFDAMPEEDRAKLNARILDADDAGQRIGETLLLIIEQLNDLKKSRLIAQLLIAFGQKLIDQETLLRLSFSVNQAFVDDLLAIVEPATRDQRSLNHLVFTGLADRVDTPAGYGGVGGGTSYRLSIAGLAFVEAIGKVEAIEEFWRRTHV